VLVILTITCSGEFLFLSILFCVLEASCTTMDKSFLRFGKFSAIILLNIVCIHLASTSSVHCLWFADLAFWLSCCVLENSFHNFCVFCVRVVLFFSLICILSQALWFWLPLVLVCWSAFPCILNLI
jgi:hypothetical protein